MIGLYEKDINKEGIENLGKGLGTQIINFCIEKAKDFLFEKCYVETMTYMKVAQILYYCY